MAKIEEKVESLVKPYVEQAGYNLYDIIYEKEGKDYYLKIFIEKENSSISVEDCETVTNILNPILDKKDLIKEEYFLVVSSTGIERKLRKLEHFQKAIGEEVKIKLFQKDEFGNKEVEGYLTEANENEEKNIKIEMSNISNANILYHWN